MISIMTAKLVIALVLFSPYDTQRCNAFALATNYATRVGAFGHDVITSDKSLTAVHALDRKQITNTALSIDEVAKQNPNEWRGSLIFSISIVTACRRLSFLLLSIAFVNTFWTAVLKVSFVK